MMSNPDNFNPEEEEYHFSGGDPDMSSFEAPIPVIQSQPKTENATPPSEKSFKNSFSMPDFSKILRKYALGEKVKALLEAIKQSFVLRVGLIAIVVLLFATLIYRCSSNPLAEKVNEKIVSVSVKHVTNKPSEMVVSRVPTVPINRNPSMETPQMDRAAHSDKMARLEKANADFQVQITAMSAQMMTLSSAVTTTANNLQQVTEQLSHLSAAIENEMKVSASLAEQLKQQMGLSKIGTPMPQAQYFLQAVIPGRAWLVNAAGKTLTVNRGSSIGHYGRVTFIDAAGGRVLTSSGQTITFSRDDD